MSDMYCLLSPVLHNIFHISNIFYDMKKVMKMMNRDNIFKRPGVAVAVLQTPLSLSD